MKRIETKLLGRPARHLSTQAKPINFTPQVNAVIVSRAEKRAARDGFPYLRDVVLVIFTLYGSGRMSAELGQAVPQMIAQWVRRENSEVRRRLAKRNFKLPRELYHRALQRWRCEAPAEGRSATAMFAFLLESYGDGDLAIALRGAGESD